MRWRRRVFFALLAFVSCGCSSDDPHPPEHDDEAGIVQNPRSCQEAREGEPVDAVVHVDGQVASCVGQDVHCSLADVAAFSTVCQVGKPSAVCHSNRWQIECVDLDAALGD